jgi:general secretion pathway protein A
MYKSFFGFTRSPFDLSPDPFFLFRTAMHNEGFASVYYGVTQKKGFIVLTGEVGTGKTLLIRTLLQILSDANVATAYVFNPRLSRDEFLRYLLDDFGIPARGGKSETLHDLNRFLIERHRKGLTTALIVDEAQELEADLLEEIRLLTNLETSTHKLLQIVLVGQPELDATLDSSRLRQLKQRVAVRSRLAPLDLEQTGTYIQHRVNRAGCKIPAETLFPPETVALIAHYSGGIPRLINNLCENSLIYAFTAQTTTVTTEFVRDAAIDLRLVPERLRSDPDPPAPDETDPQQLMTAVTEYAEHMRDHSSNRQSQYSGPKLRPW